MTQKFRGQVADIEVDDGGTTVPVGILDDPELTVTKNIEPLRGAGPITWQDLQQTEMQVEVSGTIAEWDLDTWTTFVGYDDLNDALRDDAEVPTWTTTIIYEDSEGDEAVFPVQECFTEDLPLSASREDWISMDLSFTGRTIQNVLTDSTTAGSN